MRLVPLELSLFEQLPEDVRQALRLSGVVPVMEALMPIWNLPKGTDTLLLISGRGTGKTYGISDFIANQVAVNNKRCAVLRDEKAKIKETILNEILLRFDDIPFQTGIERQETGLKKGKESLVFTMGFKASSNEKSANMKGVSNIDIAIVEEAEDIRDVDKFNSFTDGLRKEGCLVIIILNTPDVGHWILKRYCNTNETAQVPKHIPIELHSDFDGYFKVTPKEIPGFVCIQPTFRDNYKLPKKTVRDYESYGIPGNTRYNAHHYMTEIEGYASTGRKGQILRKVKPISLAAYMALPFKEFYGQDFGTASPAGMVGVKFDKNNCYCRQINYLPMNTIDIAKLYCTFGLGPKDKIIADSADKDACDKLEGGWLPKELPQDEFVKYPGLRRGFNIHRCNKGDGSIRAGLSIMDGLNIFAVEESADLWEEIRSYCYAQDKYGNYTNDPIDDKNHLIDPLRYVCEDQRGRKEFFGI